MRPPRNKARGKWFTWKPTSWSSKCELKTSNVASGTGHVPLKGSPLAGNLHLKLSMGFWKPQNFWAVKPLIKLFIFIKCWVLLKLPRATENNAFYSSGSILLVQFIVPRLFSTESWHFCCSIRNWSSFCQWSKYWKQRYPYLHIQIFGQQLHSYRI